jgi:hypothetical protein
MAGGSIAFGFPGLASPSRSRVKAKPKLARLGRRLHPDSGLEVKRAGD